MRLLLKAQNEGEAKPDAQAQSQQLLQQQRRPDSYRGESGLSKRQSSKKMHDAFKQNPMAFSSQETEVKESQRQSRVNLKGSISQFTRKQNTIATDSRNASNVAREESSRTRKLANSEHQYFNNQQQKKNIHGINMSALSKLRVSLAQNANVAEQILTRDFKKSMLTEAQDR